MEYSDVKYNVDQSIEPGIWKWTASVSGLVVMGQASTRAEAVGAAENAIDRALGPKKIRLVPPKTE